MRGVVFGCRAAYIEELVSLTSGEKVSYVRHKFINFEEFRTCGNVNRRLDSCSIAIRVFSVSYRRCIY
jgi:hypothetical protein